MIKVKNYSIKFEDQVIIEEANFEINSPLTILSGKNGTGKTTILNSIYGLNKFSGQITIDDIDVSKKSIIDIRTKYISYVKQEQNFIENLTVIENLRLFNEEINFNKLNEYLQKFNLEQKFLNNKFKKCSGGEKQKALLINALLSNSKYLFLDEVDNNVDKKTINNIIEVLIAEKRNMVVVSHSISERLIQSIDSDDIVIYQIEDKKIQRIKSSNSWEYETPIQPNNLLLNKQNKRNISKTIRWNLLLTFCALMIVTLLINQASWKLLGNLEFADVHYPGNLDEDALVIDIPVHQPWYPEYGDETWLETTPYYFTEENKQQLEALPYVESVTPIRSTSWEVDTGGYVFTDTNETYSLKPDQYDISDIELNSYGYQFEDVPNESTVELSFDHTLYPKNIACDTGASTACNDEEYIYGQYPQENSNEILIDAYFAVILANQYDMSSIEELVNKKVTLEMENPRGDKERSQEFVISGILKPRPYSDYATAGSGSPIYSNIIIPYIEKSPIVQENEPWTTNDYDAIYYQVKSTYDDLGISLKDVEKDEVGKYESFYIKLTDAKYQEDIFNQIKEHDKYIYINSIYSAEHTNYFQYYSSRIYKLVTILVVLLIISFIVIRTVAKQFINDFNKVNDSLTFYGFEPNKVWKYINTKLNIMSVVIAIYPVVIFIVKIFDNHYIPYIWGALIIIGLMLLFKWFVKKGIL